MPNNVFLPAHAMIILILLLDTIYFIYIFGFIIFKNTILNIVGLRFAVLLECLLMRPIDGCAIHLECNYKSIKCTTKC